MARCSRRVIGRRAVARGLIALACLAAAAPPVVAATRYDPRLRFRTISTPRFDIHYHQGEDGPAQRLARIAEEVAAALDRTLGTPDGRVQVILVNQDDLPNGWATPLPYNTIEIAAASPTAASLIGNVDDWLRLVFTHEYAHIVHLSRARGWIGGLRRMFGRLPVLFPNQFQPIWQIEGLATWQESASTGHGRVPAGDFRELLRRAAASGRLQPLDRASHYIIDWPSGHTPYLYGAYFHEYLARRYGPESLARLADATSRSLPYLGPLAFRKVFGASLGELWRAYESDARASSAASTRPAAARLTQHGFTVSNPRFAPDGRLFYSISNPHGFPALMSLDLRSNAQHHVAYRYLGGGLGFAGSDALFDQIEIVRDTGRQSDLYALDLRAEGGYATRRLTYGARAADPDVAPDGSAVVFTVQQADRRDLATARLSAGARLQPVVLVSEWGVDFASPRWSPDGRQIAAERRRLGGTSEIVVVDVATAQVRTVVAEGRNADPVWLPDGSGLMFASAHEGAPFEILSVDTSGGGLRKLAGLGISARSPAVSPDGESLVFVGYTTGGYDLFALPLREATWLPATLPGTRRTAVAEGPASPLPSKPYTPRGTLLPRFWTPTFESDEGEVVVGAATGGFDALGRHAYGVEGGWSAARARPDWQAAYAYDRWRPTFYASLADDTDPWRGGERRIVEGSAGVRLPTRRIRWTQTMLAEMYVGSESFDCRADVSECRNVPGDPIRRVSVRTGWTVDASRGFGYSISREEGFRIGTTFEALRAIDGPPGESFAGTLDARTYRRVWPRHAAVAVRGAAAASGGDVPLRRIFSASGSDGQPGGVDFGSDAIGLVRGLDSDALFGNRAAVVNLDYRFPLVWVERGPGTLPVFLRSIHGALFADAGSAWSAPDRFRASEVRYSLGAELSADVVLGYFAPVTVAAGGAWRGHRSDRGWTVFARLGSAF